MASRRPTPSFGSPRSGSLQTAGPVCGLTAVSHLTQLAARSSTNDGSERGRTDEKQTHHEWATPWTGRPGSRTADRDMEAPGCLARRQRRLHGKRFTVRLPFQPPFVILADPDDIKDLLTAPPDAIHPGEGARVLEPIIGR